MAAAAVLAEVAFVHVVLLMAGETLLGKTNILGIGDGLLVTGLASQILMGALQGKFALPVVIEQPYTPAIGVMALLAGDTEASLVDIVFFMASVAGNVRVLESRREMAFLARNDRMQADKRKLGQVVHEGHFAFPSLLAVALFATLAFLSFVGVGLLMAGDALRFQLFRIERIFVARLALDRLVSAAQRIFRILVVVENGLFPIRRGVATLALFAKAPLVRVVLAVAGVTAGLQLLHFGIFFVATLAFDRAVAALQLEPGIAVMVEVGLFPPIAGMAVLAFLPELARMDVVHPVAGIALLRGVLVALAGMATLAQGLAVLAAKRKIGLVVIESLLFPRGFFVAIAALFPEMALVRIVFPVTVDALRRRLAELFAGLVAIGAVGFGVAAFQLEIRAVVVEQLPVQLHHIGPAPLMLAMAIPALPLLDTGQPTVKALAVPDIAGDILVAI